MKMFRFSIILSLKFTVLVLANNHHIQPPQTVSVSRYSQTLGRIFEYANLKLQTNTYLANKNLPVWIVNANNPNILEPLSQVMNEIGPLSVYHDEKSCSAAIYFHKRQQFDGVINMNSILDNVNYNPQTKQLELSRKNFYKTSTMSHHQRNSILDPPSARTGIYETWEQQHMLALWKYVKSRLEYPNVVYVEILVIINYDISEKFENNHAKIVSHILVLMNNVDMLYSTVNEPKIKINIAGIIIGEHREAFPKLLNNNCYEDYTKVDGTLGEGIDTDCLVAALKNTLVNYKDTIYLQSYDVVIFLSNYDMLDKENKNSNAKDIGGYAELPHRNKKYKGYQSAAAHVRVAIIHEPDNHYQSFTVITHELAHLFNVFHDVGEFRDDRRECIGNLMKSPGSFCMRCLYFSERSLQQLKQFFGSRDGCIFHNEPRSLEDPRLVAKSFWNGDTQCACYGYMKEFKMQKSLRNSAINIRRGSRVEYCEEKLKCEHKKWGLKTHVITTFLMDGTPCDVDKVCWDRQCVPIAN